MLFALFSLISLLQSFMDGWMDGWDGRDGRGWGWDEVGRDGLGIDGWMCVDG